MAWEALKSAVTAVITANGNNEITGTILKNLINNNIIPLLGADRYLGLAAPSTNPPNLEREAFYFALEAGVYANLGGVTKSKGIHFFYYDGAWQNITLIEFATSEESMKNSTKYSNDGDTLIKVIQDVNTELGNFIDRDTSNLVPLTDIAGATFTGNGLTITVDKDGVILVNGTTTSPRSFELLPNITGNGGATPYFVMSNGTAYNLHLKHIGGTHTTRPVSYLKAIGASSNNFTIYGDQPAVSNTPTSDLNIGRFTLSVTAAGQTFVNAKYVLYVVEEVNYINEYRGLAPILGENTVGEKQIIDKSIGEQAVKDLGITAAKRTKSGNFALLESKTQYPIIINTVSKTLTIKANSRVVTERGTIPMSPFGSDIVKSLASVAHGIVTIDVSGGNFVTGNIGVINGDQSSNNIIAENHVILLAYYNYGAYVYCPTSPYLLDSKPFGLEIGESRIATLYNSTKEPLSFDSTNKTCTVNAATRVFPNSKPIVLPNSNIVLDLTVDYNGAATTFGSIIVYDIVTNDFKVLQHGNGLFKNEWYIIATTKGMGGNTSTPFVNSPTSYSIDGNMYGIEVTPSLDVEILSPNYENINLPAGLSLWSDFIIITIASVKEMWFFVQSSDEDHRIMDGTIHRVRVSDWSYLGSLTHNFGHCNTVDYDADNDVLLIGNLPGHYIDRDTMPVAAANWKVYYIKYTGVTDANYTNGHFYGARQVNGVWEWQDFTNANPPFDSSYQHALYAFYNVSNWVGGGNLDFLTVDKTIIDVSADTLVSISGAFAETNNGVRNIVHVVGGSQHGKILLGMGSNNLGSGNYASAAANKYNGSYKKLRGYFVYSGGFTEAGKEVIQGNSYARGSYLTANGHDEILGFLWNFTKDKILRKQVEMIPYNSDGTINETWSEGIFYDKDDDLIYQGAIEISSPNVYRIVKYKPLK